MNSAQPGVNPQQRAGGPGGALALQGGGEGRWASGLQPSEVTLPLAQDQGSSVIEGNSLCDLLSKVRELELGRAARGQATERGAPSGWGTVSGV